MDVREMPAGREINKLICEIMEPKPQATKTYRQLEQEDRGNYSCWNVPSPDGWWALCVNWGDVCGYGNQELKPDWQPAKSPSEDIVDAWEVVEKMRKNFDVCIIMTQGKIPYCQFVRINDNDDFEEYIGEAESMPLAICRASLLAMK